MMTNDVLIARSPVLSRDLFAHLFPISASFLGPQKRKRNSIHHFLSAPRSPLLWVRIIMFHICTSRSLSPDRSLLASFLGEIPRDINFPPGSDPPYRRALRTLRRDSDVFPEQSKHHSSIFIQQGPQY